jgi:toxin-antitoxin system PIN domain toxin
VTWLFDLNVLIAVADPAHVFHDTVHNWLDRCAGDSWATCPLTENGFIRVLSQPKYRGGPFTPAEVITTLAAMKQASRLTHVFWPDSVSLSDSSLILPALIAGPSQVTDVYLATLALHHHARLVTFDHSVAWQAVAGATPDLLLTLA